VGLGLSHEQTIKRVSMYAGEYGSQMQRLQIQVIPQSASSCADSGAKQLGLHDTGLELISPTLGRRAALFR